MAEPDDELADDGLWVLSDVVVALALAFGHTNRSGLRDFRKMLAFLGERPAIAKSRAATAVLTEIERKLSPGRW